jgi:hypothetical protein
MHTHHVHCTCHTKKAEVYDAEYMHQVIGEGEFSLLGGRSNTIFTLVED